MSKLSSNIYVIFYNMLKTIKQCSQIYNKEYSSLLFLKLVTE